MLGTVKKENYKEYGMLHVCLDSYKTIIYDVKDVIKANNANLV
ncbi:hypothetical protein [Clostridium botulinum]|nr:hypothetical protein [Clostridium botulinum]